jgi:hypothetical protein
MTTESAGTASPSFIAYKSPGTSSDTYYFSQAIFKEKFAIFGASKRFFASNFDDFGVFLLFFQPKLPSISYPAWLWQYCRCKPSLQFAFDSSAPRKRTYFSWKNMKKRSWRLFLAQFERLKRKFWSNLQVHEKLKNQNLKGKDTGLRLSREGRHHRPSLLRLRLGAFFW